MPSNEPAGEFAYLDWVRARIPPHPRVRVGPGDDCAVLAPTGRATVITTDMLTEGADFVLAAAGAEAVGAKAMGVNLSDIAAMAAVPTAAVVGFALPDGPGGRSIAEGLFRGLKRMADRHGVPVVGGDTGTWPGGLVVSVTILGEVTDKGPVLRDGARPDDWLFVTGPLGGSIRGRHLTPTPRVAEALALHQFADLHALCDISDGLAADLGHILVMSGCGAELDAAAIPIHADAVAHAVTTGRPPLDHALGDGEDFELVFAVAPADGARLVAGSPVPVWRIGECIESGLWLRDGGRRRLEPAGWEHRLGGSPAVRSEPRP